MTSTAERINPWLRALIHCVLASVIMLLLRFPKPEIAFLGILIFWGTVYWRLIEAKRAAPAPRQITRPVIFLTLSFLIAIGTLTLFATLLFGSISFRQSLDRWHRYEGQPFHRADFEVQQVYFEEARVKVRGGVCYAFGLVEGSRERMDVGDYLHYEPSSQAELDRRFPAGTRIPVYVFPDLKGRYRVQVYQQLPPAEANHRLAMKVLKYSLLILTGTSVALFVLFRLLKLCVAASEPRLPRPTTT